MGIVALGEATISERIAYAREPRKLPTVLSAEEVVRFLESLSNLKARVTPTTAYAAGLRVSEIPALKVCDIDSRRVVMLIEHGKGDKERYAVLSQTLLGILRAYWRLARPHFPGPDPGQASRGDCAARGLPFGGGRSGARQAGQRPRAPAQLRHPPARAGRRHTRDQVLLGHENLSTKARYTRVLTAVIGGRASPLDKLSLSVTPPG